MHNVCTRCRCLNNPHCFINEKINGTMSLLRHLQPLANPRGFVVLEGGDDPEPTGGSVMSQKYQLTSASPLLLDLCQHADALFNSSKPELQRELLDVILSNALLSDKSLTY
jgi:hypothetical protein